MRHTAIFLAVLLAASVAQGNPWPDAGGGGASILTSGSDGDSSTAESDSGLELVDGKLTLLRGCGDNEIPKWDETEDDWNCEADAGAAGGDSVSIDGSAVVDPDFISTGDIDFIDTSNDVTGDINAGAVAEDELAASITFNDADLLDFGTFVTSATEGLMFPAHASDCSTATAEGQVCWQEDTDLLSIGDDGTAIVLPSRAEDLSQFADTLALTFRGLITGTTGTGNLVFSTSPDFATDIQIGAGGVTLAAGAGVLTLTGEGAGEDENLLIDFDATANTIGLSSTTGADLITLGSFGLSTDGTVWSGNSQVFSTLHVGSVDGDGTLIIYDNDGADDGTVTIQALDAMGAAASYTLTLPPDDGDNTEVLGTDGNGVLNWVANEGGGLIFNADIDANAQIVGTKINSTTPTTRGTIELATQVEVDAGADSLRAIAPVYLHALDLTTLAGDVLGTIGAMTVNDVQTDAIAEIADIHADLKSGDDVTLVTGTHTTDVCAEWNSDGDIVAAASGQVCGAGGAEVNTLTTSESIGDGGIWVGSAADVGASIVFPSTCAVDEKLDFTHASPDTLTCVQISGLVDADIGDIANLAAGAVDALSELGLMGCTNSQTHKVNTAGDAWICVDAAETTLSGDDTDGDMLLYDTDSFRDVPMSGEATMLKTGEVTIADSVTVDSWSLGNPTLTGTGVFPIAGTPTTDADGEFSMDTDGWGSGFDALELFNGTASAYAVATTAGDSPSNGQVPKWNTGGEITWEDDLNTGSFDSTNVDATTWSDNANASNVWTFDVSGTDHTMTAGNGLMTFSHAVTVTGTLTGDLTGAVTGNADTATLAATGDSATAFFDAGTIEDARLPTIPVAKGGTGSAYFDVAGPSQARTYTFPDADSTMLANSGVLATSMTECVKLLAGGAIPLLAANTVTIGAVDGANFAYTAAQFDSSDDTEAVLWEFDLPANFDAAGAVTAQYKWTNDTGTTDTVCLAVATDSFADDAAFRSGSMGADAGATDTSTASDDIMVSPSITVTESWVAEEHVIFTARRDVAGDATGCSADSMAEDMHLLMVNVCYEIDNIFSGE